MFDIKIKKVSNYNGLNNEIIYESKGCDYLNESLIKNLFCEKNINDEHCEMSLPKEAVKPVTNKDKVKEETVVIYDDDGIPSIMRKFSMMTNKELFGGSNNPHPAFIIDGEVYDEIYISVYPNCEINGKPYSLPFRKLWTNITNDTAARVCFSKGEGWHLMTAAEWGLIANISLKNNTLPHGNTKSGHYHTNCKECGVVYNEDKTLAGSGSTMWTHNHKSDGVHDLCGNVWEMIRGLRVKNGIIQTVKDNDAAMNIDISELSDKWIWVTDDKQHPIYNSYNIKIDMECVGEQLKTLALYNGEPNAHMSINDTYDEYLGMRGGCNGIGSRAGVFAIDLNVCRYNSDSFIGFRSAYYKKR